MKEKEPLTLGATVMVNQDRAMKVEIMTEPGITGRWLATLTQILEAKRHDLENGRYDVSYTAENGILVHGDANARSADLMARYLAGPMADLHGFLRQGAAMLDFTDASAIEHAAKQIAIAMSAVFATMSDYAFSQGGIGKLVMVGCPTCGGTAYDNAKALFSLRSMEGNIPDGQRAAYAAEVARYMAMDLPEVYELTAFQPGLDCSHPFAKVFNPKLEARLNALKPQVETRVIELVAGANTSLLAKLQAWKA